MSIVGKLGGIEGQQTISEVITPGGGSGNGGIRVFELEQRSGGAAYLPATWSEIKNLLLDGVICVVKGLTPSSTAQEYESSGSFGIAIIDHAEFEKWESVGQTRYSCRLLMNFRDGYGPYWFNCDDPDAQPQLEWAD